MKKTVLCGLLVLSLSLPLAFARESGPGNGSRRDGYRHQKGGFSWVEKIKRVIKSKRSHDKKTNQDSQKK